MSSRWIRSKDGAIFGVCKGLARTLDVPVGMLRLLWLASVLFAGFGLGFYMLLSFCLPREDRLAESCEPRLLGVCAKLSRRISVEVGIVRLIVLTSFLASLGMTTILYVIGYFLLED
jgi:phage shock protein PspC (stress-responsive transcriptional regulator)